MPSDRNFDHLYPEFRLNFELVLKELTDYCDKHWTGYVPFLTEGFRTAAYQFELYRIGRTTKPIGKSHIVTNLDGYIRRSNHQSSLAADIGFKKGNKAEWGVPAHVLNYYGHLCRKHGLVWGGDWKGFVDRLHCEWPTKDKRMYTKAREWQKSLNLR